MWYGNATVSFTDEAERLTNSLKLEQRKTRIAKWVSDAAFQKLKQQAKFRELVLKESNNGRAL